MPLTPQDIVRKEFREAFRGYNQAEVDLFLDEIVEEYTRVAEDNQKMKVRIAALQQELARLREGRGAAAAPGPAGEAPRVEAEVRARVRRFLEEQIRMIDAGAPTPTAERVAREVPQPPEGRAPPLAGAGEDDAAQPFWAGE